MMGLRFSRLSLLWKIVLSTSVAVTVLFALVGWIVQSNVVSTTSRSLEDEVLPAAAEFKPQLVLISAGFDAHRDDPLAECRLQASSFARMATVTRDAARDWGAPVGAVLEGGYDLPALADSVVATMAALGGASAARSRSKTSGPRATGRCPKAAPSSP